MLCLHVIKFSSSEISQTFFYTINCFQKGIRRLFKMSTEARHFPPYPDYNNEVAKKILVDTRVEVDSETSSKSDSKDSPESSNKDTFGSSKTVKIKKASQSHSIKSRKSRDSTQTKKSKKSKGGSFVYFKVKKEVEVKVDALITKLYDSIMDAVPNLTGPNSDFSIYTGYTGIAYVNYLLFKKTKDKAYFKVAKDLVMRALKELKGRRISFLNGDAGPLALGAVLNILEENDDVADELIDKLVKLGDKPETQCPDEVLYGRAGYLHALLFVDQETRPVIPEMVLRKTVEKILKSGSREAAKKKINIPLYYEWHEKVYLGAAHGYAGILYTLLLASRYMTDYELDSLVRPTIEWLINAKFPSSNFPSSIGSKTDRLVQWCHGAPGFTLLLSLAAQVYKSQRYHQLALDCGDVVWERGLLKKGYSLCHGITGNAYTFLHLYQMTRDIKHLYRASSYIDWCTRYPANEGMRPDRPYSLFEGRAGLLYFLVDSKDPIHSAFPCYELKLSV